MPTLTYFSGLSPAQRKAVLLQYQSFNPYDYCYVCDARGIVQQRVPLPPLFELGKVKFAAFVRVAIGLAGHTVNELLCRHKTGDWLHMAKGDQAANHRAVEYRNAQVVTVFALANGDTVYVITDAQRKGTVILLSDV